MKTSVPSALAHKHATTRCVQSQFGLLLFSYTENWLSSSIFVTTVHNHIGLYRHTTAPSPRVCAGLNSEQLTGVNSF